MNSEELANAWQAYKADQSQVLRNRLAEHYGYLVRSTAEKIARSVPSSVDVEDLASAGMFGLLAAIECFDLDRGLKFVTYSAIRIRGAILDSLRQGDWVPRLIRLRASKIERAIKTLQLELCRLPTDAELAQRLQLSPAELESWRGEVEIVKVESCDQLAFTNDDSWRPSTIGHLEPSRSTRSPASRMSRADLMRVVSRGLSRAERLIVILLYFEELTMKQVGATLGCSESRVSQIHSALIERLREKLQPRRDELYALARA